MSFVALPLPRLGMDVLSQETQIPAGCVRFALNVNIDRNGQVYRRAGRKWLDSGAWSRLFDFGGKLIAQKGRQVFRFDMESWTPSLIAQVASDAPIDCTIYNQCLYFVDRRGVWRLGPHDSEARMAGVAPPATLPVLAAGSAGQIAHGRCAVALSWVDVATGEESPVQWLGQVMVPAPSGGVVLSRLPLRADRRWRVYVSPPDGEVLYLAEEFDAVWPQYAVGQYPKGAPCSALGTRLMPGGEFVRGFKGRLLVADGKTLFFSEALRPHVCQAATGFVAFASPIRFIEPVSGGVFVGQADGVFFLAGDDPLQWYVRRVSDAVPVAHSAQLVAVQRLGLQGGGECALWLSARGHMAGMQGGEVLPLNARRMRCATDHTKKLINLCHKTTIWMSKKSHNHFGCLL